MRYISFCSGVEAASQAWMPLGWECVALSEVDPFPCAILASRFPGVPNLGDCRNIHYDQTTKELYVRNSDGVVSNRFYAGDIDLCVGGFPCQSFSVAGKREGLEGASGLILEYFRLLDEIRPRWVVYENVPGMLSSNGGADFKLLVRKFVECGYGICWRTLDTQYVRVESFPRAIPQRRRRVFVVGHLADDGGGGCEVLLEPEGVRGDPPPRRVKGKGVAGDTVACAGGAENAVGVKSEEMVRMANHEKETIGNIPLLFKSDEKVSGNAPSVAISFKGGQSAAGGLGVDEGACKTMQSKMSALEPTVAISFLPTNTAKARSLGEAEEVAPTMARGGGESGNKPSVAIRTENDDGEGIAFIPYGTRLGADKNGVAKTMTRIDEKFPQCVTVKTTNGVECLCPEQPQGHRVYGDSGSFPCLQSMHGAGYDQSAICVNEPYNIMTCDGGSHKRDDRPNGGMYVRKADSANCMASCGNGDTVVAVKTANTTVHGDNVNESGASYTIDGANGQAVAIGIDQQGGKGNAGFAIGAMPTICSDSHGTPHAVAIEGEQCPERMKYHYAVRRITPIEGERLQGFADNWTRPCFTPDQITDELVDRFCGIHQNWSAINGKPDAKPKSREWVRKWLTTISSPDCPDGPRYKAIGNSMSVNVMLWIGMRIDEASHATNMVGNALYPCNAANPTVKGSSS